MYNLLFLECKTSNTTHMAILGGFKVKVLERDKKCVFPFRYKKKVYHTCTNDKACSSCYWCGTQFNVSFSSGWGMCNSDCPIDKGRCITFYIFDTYINSKVHTITVENRVYSHHFITFR